MPTADPINPTPSGGNGANLMWGYGELPAPAPSQLDAERILHALRRRWLLALGLGLVFAAAAGTATWYLVPAEYEAFSLLQVLRTEPRIAFDIGDDATRNREDYEIYRRTQEEMIKSPFVLNTALRREDSELGLISELGLVRQQRKEPVDWLQEELNVVSPRNTEILRISLRGPDPAELRVLVNAVTHAYLEEIVNRGRNMRLARLQQLEDSHLDAEQKLRIKRSEFYGLAERLGTGDPDALTVKQKRAIELDALMHQSLIQWKFELSRGELELGLKKAALESDEELPISGADVEEWVDQDPVVREYLVELALFQGFIDEYQSLIKIRKVPSLSAFVKRKEFAEKALDARRAKVRPEITERLQRRMRGELEFEVTQLEDAVGLLSKLEEELAEGVRLHGEQVDNIGRSSVDLELKRDEVEQVKQVAETLATEMEALRVELGSPQRIRLLQDSDLPRTKEDIPVQIALVTLAVVGSLFAVTFCVSWCELRARRISTADELKHRLGMKVIGAVPNLPVPLIRRLRRSKFPTDLYPHSVFADSIDGIRTMLLHEAGVESTRVVMITSAVAREAKTTLASHLAVSLASAGRRTLLVDCDLRRPAIHELFGMSLSPGLSEVISGEADLGDVIQETGSSGLSVIPAGKFDRQAIQSLAKDGLQEHFDRLKEDFEFIVVDASPVLPVADALLIGRHVDAAVLSTLRDVSRAPNVQAACERLEAVGIRVLGAVVNGARGEYYAGKK